MPQLLSGALLAGGLVVGLLMGVLMVWYVQQGLLSTAVAVIGLLLGLLIFSLPQLALGVYLIKFSRQTEETPLQTRTRQQLLALLEESHQYTLPDLIYTLNISEDELQTAVHQATLRNEFSGYINWEKGMLYSRQVTK
jgi:hypothetical protein